MLSSIIATVWPIAKKYGVAALALAIGLGVASYSFFHWKNSLIDQGHEKGVAECNKERSEVNAEAIAAYQEAMDALILRNSKNQEEFENALNVYANRPADVVIKRVPVRVKASCPVGNSAAGSTENRTESSGIGGSFIEAELSPGAVRNFERIMNDIQLLQSQCLLVKEAQRINQGD